MYIGSNYNNYSNSNIFTSMYSKQQKSNNDLYSLMKLADEVRSPAYAKKIKESLKNGTSVDSSSEVGTVASESKLSETANALHKAAAGLNGISMEEINDKDTLVKKMNSFADKYNAAIDAMGKSDSVDALRAGVQMTNTVKTYSGALKRIGVTVGVDNKLKIDEEKLRSADSNAVSSMLRNNYSPVTRIADRAEDISKAAANKARTTAFRNMAYGSSSGSNTTGYGGYNGFGGYNNYASSFIGTLFDSLI